MWGGGVDGRYVYLHRSILVEGLKEQYRGGGGRTDADYRCFETGTRPDKVIDDDHLAVSSPNFEVEATMLKLDADGWFA
jgi:hypothetical protein